LGRKYLAILDGRVAGAIRVDQPLGDDTASPVFVKSMVVAGGRLPSRSSRPVASAGGFTLVRVVDGSGRKHQIRAHAQWLGHAVIGDKIYGPDARLYLEFIETGMDGRAGGKTALPRQALHCAEIDLRTAGLAQCIRRADAGRFAGFLCAAGFVPVGLGK